MFKLTCDIKERYEEKLVCATKNVFFKVYVYFMLIETMFITNRGRGVRCSSSQWIITRRAHSGHCVEL